MITPLYLTINERVRKFGGDPSYANFLMYLGLGMLKQRKGLKFDDYTDDFIRFPRRVADHEILKNFEDVDEFCKFLYPDMETSRDIPEGVVLTPKNMNMLNNARLVFWGIPYSEDKVHRYFLILMAK